MTAKDKQRIRNALKKGSEGHGLGYASAEVCADFLKGSESWTDWDWTVMGLQLGIV